MVLTSAVATSVRKFLVPSFASERQESMVAGQFDEDLSEPITGIWERNLNLHLNPISCYISLYPLQVKPDTQNTLSWVFSIHADITHRWWKAGARIALIDTSPLFRAYFQKQHCSFIPKWSFRVCCVKQLAGDRSCHTGLSCTVRGLEFHTLCLHIFSSFNTCKD